MTYDGDWRETFRPDIPSAARIYDYLLGGKDNYPADRAAAESMIARLPDMRLAVQRNRAFLRRVVRYLVADAGIRQIIDFGAGLPTVGNTHEIALQACPQARVVYVDHDPVVLAHARNMLHNVPGTAIIERNLTEPEQVLADPALRELIDFGQPVALLFLSVLDFVADDDDPAGLIARLLAPFPAAATSRSRTPHRTPSPRSATWSGSSRRPPSRRMCAAVSQVARLVAGLEIIEPGLVWPPEWRPGPGEPQPASVAGSYYCVVVARKPGPARTPGPTRVERRATTAAPPCEPSFSR